jgi:DNA-binding beta-propeller fold protein YncE
MRTVTATLLAALAVLAAAAAAAEPAGYRLLKTIPVPGDGGWDYVSVDDAGRRVYVSHATQVDVLDADSGEIKGKIPDTKGVHGIAVAADCNRGFTSNGRDDTLTVFDLKTLETLDHVKTGRGPDAICYDPDTHQVFAFCGRGGSATVIDAAKGTVTGTIDLGGQPETGVPDGAGLVFVNLEDKGELLKIDSRNRKVLERWPLAPGKTPTGLALDRRNHRLFVGCRGGGSGRAGLQVVVNADTGKVITTLPIGEGVDASAFDPETGLVFSSCRDGTVTVIHQENADDYKVVETVKTRQGSKTMALDPKTHRLFIPGAEFKAASDNPRGRPSMVPGSFVVMIFGK